MLKAFTNISKFSSALSRKMSSSSPSKKFVGLCQMRSTNDKYHNREQISELFLKAKGQASVLFFPECCDYLGSNAAETQELAEPLTGETVKFYQDLCAKNQIWGSFGGIHELATDDEGNETGKIYNSHIIINSNGEIAGLYRKMHLFDVETPEMKFRESKYVGPGAGAVYPIETPVGKVGLTICYDLRFAEPAIWMKTKGANILTYPSAFAVSTGKAHWEVLQRARAIENQCYVISAAQFGKHNEKRTSFGHAMAVDPFGKIIAECTEELELQIVEIDLEKISKVESNMPCFQHRRQDVYAIEMKTVDYLKPIRDQEPFMFEKYPVSRETIFLETDYCVAFTNIRCVVQGHVLIATKRCIPRVEQMTVEEKKDMFVISCKVAKVLDDYYDAKSTTITIQDGEFAGQTVKHVHCHIMPRKPGDFEHNDEIYIELNKHDQNDVQETRRPLKDMIEEAKIYKNLLKQ